jgi:formylglycine-generating enzyme required for sulfatase activity
MPSEIHPRKATPRGMALAAACLLLPWAAGAQLQLSIAPAEQPLVSVNGPTGTMVQVQWSDTLNAPGRWFHLTNYILGSGMQFTDPNPPAVGARFYRAVVLPKTTVNLVPGGSFAMGDTFSEGFTSERPVHGVTVSSFYMDRTEVTRVDWDSIYIWATGQGYSFDNGGGGKGPTHPVHTVNWYDTVKWCNAKSEMEGKTPVYYASPAQTNVYRTGRIELSNYHVRWAANGYRLPTEAEWERATRSGEAGARFPWGNVITFSNANYQSFDIYTYDQGGTNGYHPAYAVGDYPYTSPVGSFLPNAYGLHDLVGNVWEWCWDRFDPAWYSNAHASWPDPKGPSGGTVHRVMRGGSWSEDASFGRCANRAFTLLEAPDSADFSAGFRTVMALPGFISPVVLDDAAALPNGAIRFTLYNLTPGKTNIVETSTNVVSWSAIATNVPSVAALNFTNNAPASPTGRFYRSRQLP